MEECLVQPKRDRARRSVVMRRIIAGQFGGMKKQEFLRSNPCIFVRVILELMCKGEITFVRESIKQSTKERCDV